MSKFNGFGGGFGGGNMQQMLKQAQKMQEDLQKAQEELEDTEITGSAGGGVVEVSMTGSKQLLSVKIKPEAVDPDDVEMLEDLLIAAFNEAMKEADKMNEELLGPMAGMLGK